MKILLITMLFCLNTASASQIEERIDLSVEAISLELVDQMMEQKALSCVAATYCADGRLLRCETFGEACTYFVQPAVAIRCTGYNLWGQWVDLVGRCF